MTDAATRGTTDTNTGHHAEKASDTHWPDYYEITAERPSWTTTRIAAEAFGEHPQGGPRFAVDLGCGAGRDARELLRRGWRVLATDMTPRKRRTARPPSATTTTSTSSRSWPCAAAFPMTAASGSIRPVSDLMPTGAATIAPSAARVAMADDAPAIEDLFSFAHEAELRVQTLRMTIDERVVTAKGADRVVHEIQLKHPGHARVATKRSSEPLTRDYDIWISDGQTITAYEASNKIASVRRQRPRVAGSDDSDLPPFARQYQPLTALPAGSLADTFIHPHGLFRNVLVTGPLAVVGVQPVADREAIVVRAQHPRSAKVLVDRPDRSIEVGIGRDSGFVLLLTERIGDTVTRHAEVTKLELDATIFEAAFELKLPSDVRRVY